VIGQHDRLTRDALADRLRTFEVEGLNAKHGPK
jgi:hypothetical protein